MARICTGICGLLPWNCEWRTCRDRFRTSILMRLSGARGARRERDALVWEARLRHSGWSDKFLAGLGNQQDNAAGRFCNQRSLHLFESFNSRQMHIRPWPWFSTASLSTDCGCFGHARIDDNRWLDTPCRSVLSICRYFENLESKGGHW